MEGANQIIELALGLPGTPWRLVSMTLDKDKRLVTIHLGFERGAKFPHPQTKELLGVEDTAERVWRHLNFFAICVRSEGPIAAGR